MTAIAITRSAKEINDAMLRVYNHMFLAILTSLATSGLVGYNHTLMSMLFGTPIKWVVIFAPLVAVFAISWKISSVSKTTAVIMLHGFAAIMGLSLSTIFVTYQLGSIVTAFMGAAVLFGTMSFYGYFTRRSLDSLGQFLFVGLIAVVVASLINIWLQNSVMQMVLSAIAVIVFAGLTAYDTQKIREIVSYDNAQNNSEVAGALSLYLDFINMFVALLQLFGDRKE